MGVPYALGVPGHAYVPEAHVSLPTRYASCLVANSEVIACSGGKHIHLLSRDSLQRSGALTGHKINVAEICWFPDAPTRLASCGADNSAKVWDIRQQTCAATYALDGEPLCVTVLDDNVIALGVEERVELWDMRMNQKFVFRQVHNDVVACVRRHPLKSSILVSAGDDGLVCQLDTAMLDEEDGIPWVVNNEDNVRKVHFVGEAQNHVIITASTTEVIRIWSEKCEKLGEFADILQSPALCKDDSAGYVVHAFHENDRAFVLGGSNDGTLALFHLNLQGLSQAHSFEDRSEGHLGVVRSALCLDSALLTGDENGRLIAWRLR